MENIDIDKDNLKNIHIYIDMAILENIHIDIDIQKGILQNIDIDKVLYRLGFGISNTPICTSPPLKAFSYFHDGSSTQSTRQIKKCKKE